MRRSLAGYVSYRTQIIIDYWLISKVDDAGGPILPKTVTDRARRSFSLGM